MILSKIFAVGIGAIVGSLFRYGLIVFCNPLFSQLALGPLFANLFGGLCMGVFMFFSQNYPISETLSLGIVVGFLGGFTTFSAFSGETVSLFLKEKYFFAFLGITGHVLGSIGMTFLGWFLGKKFL